MTIQDRQFGSFEFDSSIAKWRRLVKDHDSEVGLLSGVTYDSIKCEYPSSAVEVFKYYLGGITGTLQTTITVTYTDNTKAFIDTVVGS